MTRQESSRVHSEFEKFYTAHPEYRVQANHRQFIEIAEESGGSETLTKEQMELWLDDPTVLSRLVVLVETPEQAFAKFFQVYPAFEFDSNRNVLEAYLKTHSWVVTFDNLKEAARHVELALDQDVLDRQLAQREQEEREQLIEIVVLDHSKGAYAQEIQRGRCRFYSTDQLRAMVANINERRELARLTPAELRSRIKQAQSDNAPAVELPAEMTPAAIKRLPAEQLRLLVKRYGQDAVNDRLGYVKPEIGGNVREVNLTL